MGFSQPYAAIDKKGIICLPGRFGNRDSGRMGKLIAITRNKILKCIFRIEIYSFAGKFYSSVFEFFYNFFLIVLLLLLDPVPSA